MLQGVYTALITPLENNRFHEESFHKLLEHQVKT